MSEKLLLIDGFSLLFRAYYGMPMGMTSPDGVHTNAIYGFLSVLNKMIEDEAPDYMAVALDRKSTRLNSSHPTTSRMPSSA